MPHVLLRLLILAAAGVALGSVTSAAAGDVKIDIGLGVPPIVLATPPALVVVPGTSVYYAPDVPANYFFYKGRYYTVANGVWLRAPVYDGPWVVIQIGKVPAPVLTVPVEYYKIPPGHLKQKGQGHGPRPKKPKKK